MHRLAKASKGPGNVYFTGGATMLLLGIREQTIDVDIKLDPEPKGVFEAISTLKNELDLNIELASPDDFLPPPSDWREKSLPIQLVGDVAYFHYDFRAQALAKIERGHQQDLSDVNELLRKSIVHKDELLTVFQQIKSELVRYPAIDPDQFEQKLQRCLQAARP